MGGEGDLELEVFFSEVASVFAHAKGDSFEHPFILFEVEFKVGLSYNFWGPGLDNVGVEDRRRVSGAVGL